MQAGGDKPRRSLSIIAPLAMVFIAAMSAGCNRSPAGPPPGTALPKPEVDGCVPRALEVRDYEDFPGRIEAVNAVSVRARVTGYLLDKMSFKEGEEVKKG